MSSPPDRLRVLSVFNRYLERGGEEIAVERIAAELRETTHLRECTFASSTWKAQILRTVFQPLWMIYNPSSIATLRRMQRAERFDCWLLHNVFPVGSAAVYREADRLDVPVVQYIHNFRPFSVSGYLWSGDRLALGGLQKDYREEILGATWQDSHVKTWWFATVLRLMHALGWWKHVGAWIAISDFMRDQFIGAGVPAEDIFTLRHFWRSQADPPVPRDDGHYLFLGRLIPAKGIETLLQTWQLLEETLGARTPKLIIAGEGPLEKKVAAFAAGSRFVEYTGHLADERKRAVIEGCRALLVPSLWWEPLGLVVYEAYDAAKPVLAAASGGLTETVADGQTGRLHPPGNAAELARQIIEIDQDAPRRLAMGARGREWLREHASEEAWQRGFLRAAEHAIRKRRARTAAD